MDFRIALGLIQVFLNTLGFYSLIYFTYQPTHGYVIILLSAITFGFFWLMQDFDREMQENITLPHITRRQWAISASVINVVLASIILVQTIFNLAGVIIALGLYIAWYAIDVQKAELLTRLQRSGGVGKEDSSSMLKVHERNKIISRVITLLEAQGISPSKANVLKRVREAGVPLSDSAWSDYVKYHGSPLS